MVTGVVAEELGMIDRGEPARDAATRKVLTEIALRLEQEAPGRGLQSRSRVRSAVRQDDRGITKGEADEAGGVMTIPDHRAIRQAAGFKGARAAAER